MDETVAGRVTRLISDYIDDDGRAIDPVAGPIAIRSGSAMMLVRLVDADPPLLRVFSPLLRSVACSPDLLAELNEINAHLGFLRLFWRDDTVFAATELLAGSLDAEVFTHACDCVADLSDYYDERLRDRFGGELAFAKEQSEGSAQT